jgi:PilZ domain-containing protein
VTQTEWEWPISTHLQNHRERVPLLRPVPFEMTTQVDDPSDSANSGKALSLNISSGGMLVLMDHAPGVEQVLKVLVPTPTSSAGTPTLAEVRWTRKLPFGSSKNEGAYFVGLKFLF